MINFNFDPKDLPHLVGSVDDAVMEVLTDPSAPGLVVVEISNLLTDSGRCLGFIITVNARDHTTEWSPFSGSPSCRGAVSGFELQFLSNIVEEFTDLIKQFALDELLFTN